MLRIFDSSCQVPFLSKIWRRHHVSERSMRVSSIVVVIFIASLPVKSLLSVELLMKRVVHSRVLPTRLDPISILVQQSFPNSNLIIHFILLL